MSRVIEVGPYHSIDPNNWGENYSERRHLARMEWEMAQYFGFVFSFEEHIGSLVKRFANVPILRVLDGGCGEGTALTDLRKLIEGFGARIETTGITLDPRHKDGLTASGIDEVVIGSVEHFFETEGRENYYQFILDYVGAISYDNPGGIQGANLVPIYARILASGGTALLSSPPISPRWLEQNGLRVIQGSSENAHCVLVTK